MNSWSAAARFLALLAALVLGGDVLARETTANRYTIVPASLDGIGKVYMGREIARVMGFPGASWLERPERTREERPDLVLQALDLQPGMMVADIGAGTGFYAWRIAQQVGDAGIVYAVDIQPRMLTLLDRQLARQGTRNVKPVLGTPTDPKLPDGVLDLALLVDVYHELEYPYETMEAIVRASKPGGQLVFVEYKAEDAGVPIKPLHKMSEAQVKSEASVHSLEWVKTVTTIPWQHLIVFRKRG